MDHKLEDMLRHESNSKGAAESVQQQQHLWGCRVSEAAGAKLRLSNSNWTRFGAFSDLVGRFPTYSRCFQGFSTERQRRGGEMFVLPRLFYSKDAFLGHN